MWQIRCACSTGEMDHTVSVIDLNTFTEIKKIDVAVNLHRMKADRYGCIYVSSRGDYYDGKSDLHMINSRTDEVEGPLIDTCQQYVYIR